MEPLIIQIHNALIKNKRTIAIAESATGGLLSNYLTQVSGSSQYFVLGVIAYSNRIKEEVLKIPAGIILKYGAASKNVAKLMAESVRLMAKTNFGIGITGIAGPTGGKQDKPVGTVFIAIDGKSKKLCKKFHFSGNRIAVRKKAALKALALLRALI